MVIGVLFRRHDAKRQVNSLWTRNNGVGQNAQFDGVGVDNIELVEIGQTRLRYPQR
jgi:hypothetical protein